MRQKEAVRGEVSEGWRGPRYCNKYKKRRARAQAHQKVTRRRLVQATHGGNLIARSETRHSTGLLADAMVKVCFGAAVWIAKPLVVSIGCVFLRHNCSESWG